MAPIYTSDNTVLADYRTVRFGRSAKDNDQPDVTSVVYDDMSEHWQLIDDLWGGTSRMREARERWLPREPQEEPKAYQVRLTRSFLFDAYKDTVTSVTAKPFSREIIVREEEQVPERLTATLDNVDNAGTTLTAFAKKLFLEGCKYGHSMVFVDYPVVGQVFEGRMTLADEQRLRVRPYWTLISTPNMLGWKTGNTITSGEERLLEIRWLEKRVEPDGRFGDKEVPVVKVVTAPPAVLQPNFQAVFEDESLPPAQRFGTITEFIGETESGGLKWREQDAQFHTYPGIPLVWLPIDPTGDGLLRSQPPFRGLAELNLEHWQKASDLTNILRFVAIAMCLLTGIEEDHDDEEVTGGTDTVAWGVNQIIYGPPGSDGKYIEHSGQGIGSLEARLKKIEEKMEMKGMEPFVSRQQDVTATAHRKDDQKTTTLIQSWVRQLEKTLRELLDVSATWLKEEVPEGVAFDVFNEFGLKVATRDDVDVLLQACDKNKITVTTFINEWKKRGVLGEEVDADAEFAEIKAMIEQMKQALTQEESEDSTEEEPEPQEAVEVA